LLSKLFQNGFENSLRTETLNPVGVSARSGAGTRFAPKRWNHPHTVLIMAPSEAPGTDGLASEFEYVGGGMGVHGAIGQCYEVRASG